MQARHLCPAEGAAEKSDCACKTAGSLRLAQLRAVTTSLAGPTEGPKGFTETSCKIFKSEFCPPKC